MVLTGSAFLDARKYFPLYQHAAAGAKLVDELFNCEDVLMNFVVANATRSGGGPAAVFVRSRLRIDVSFTSGNDAVAFREQTAHPSAVHFASGLSCMAAWCIMVQALWLLAPLTMR